MTLGTAALAKDDPNAFPFGALGMALMSTWATVLYSIPIFANTVLDIAGVQQRTGSVVQAKAQDDKKKPAKVCPPPPGRRPPPPPPRPPPPPPPRC